MYEYWYAFFFFLQLELLIAMKAFLREQHIFMCIVWITHILYISPLNLIPGGTGFSAHTEEELLILLLINEGLI